MYIIYFMFYALDSQRVLKTRLNLMLMFHSHFRFCIILMRSVFNFCFQTVGRVGLSRKTVSIPTTEVCARRCEVDKSMLTYYTVPR